VSADDIELAEKLTSRRARVSIFLGIMFLTSMVTSLGVDVPESRPETIKLAAWVVWAAALLFLLSVGGGLFRGKSVRALMNDDSTVENRRQAMVAGFWAAVLSAFVLYALTFYEPISSREVIRLMLSAAVGAAIIKFGILEQRSLGDA
jgi:ABC-type multidrug transport system fused ATPase/permease subunit